MGSSKHQFACIQMAAVHNDKFCTSTGYRRISLVRAVSVQVLFLSKPYEENNTKFVLL